MPLLLIIAVGLFKYSIFRSITPAKSSRNEPTDDVRFDGLAVWRIKHNVVKLFKTGKCGFAVALFARLHTHTHILHVIFYCIFVYEYVRRIYIHIYNIKINRQTNGLKPMEMRSHMDKYSNNFSLPTQTHTHTLCSHVLSFNALNVRFFLCVCLSHSLVCSAFGLYFQAK